jgi:hypothetical protein
VQPTATRLAASFISMMHEHGQFRFVVYIYIYMHICIYAYMHIYVSDGFQDNIACTQATIDGLNLREKEGEREEKRRER